MSYTQADLPVLLPAIVREGGLWPMMKKDLCQIVNSPSLFEKVAMPAFGTGMNLSVSIVLMSTLEAISTLANIDGAIAGRSRNYAMDVVVKFGERYLPRANPRYAPSPGTSLVRLVWDAYRNGGLHKFLPKKIQLVRPAGTPVSVDFGVGWAEDGSRPRCSMTLDEVQALRSRDPMLSMLRPPHLALALQAPDVAIFSVCAQALVLELMEAGDAWSSEVVSNAQLQTWFIDGANAFEEGRALSGGQGRAWLEAALAGLP